MCFFMNQNILISEIIITIITIPDLHISSVRHFPRCFTYVTPLQDTAPCQHSKVGTFIFIDKMNAQRGF